jgi:hypothetical protein
MSPSAFLHSSSLFLSCRKSIIDLLFLLEFWRVTENLSSANISSKSDQGFRMADFFLGSTMSSASTSSSSESAKSPSPVRLREKPLKRKRRDEADLSDSENDDDSDAGPNDDIETPALSHAERRRQKKKEERGLKKSASASTPATKKRKLKDGLSVTSSSVSKKEKRQNSVWVGNISFKTAPDALRGFFDGVGEITRIHMPMKAGAKGENMGSVIPGIIDFGLQSNRPNIQLCICRLCFSRS